MPQAKITCECLSCKTKFVATDEQVAEAREMQGPIFSTGCRCASVVVQMESVDV